MAHPFFQDRAEMFFIGVLHFLLFQRYLRVMGLLLLLYRVPLDIQLFRIGIYAALGTEIFTVIIIATTVKIRTAMRTMPHFNLLSRSGNIAACINPCIQLASATPPHLAKISAGVL
jgi:hypothetical protein